MSRLTTEVSRTRAIEADHEDVWEVVSEPERHGDLMPKVESLERTERGWRWVMRSEQRFGQTLQPTFTVSYAFEETDAVRFEKVEDPEDSAEAEGAIELTPNGDATEVTFRISIGFEVSIPSMLRGPAGSMLRREVEGLVSGFLDNLESTVAG